MDYLPPAEAGFILTATQASPQGSRQFTFVRFARVKVHRDVELQGDNVLLSF
jgi:hypothetical protein